MKWSVPDWDMPLPARVVLVSLAICVSVGLVLFLCFGFFNIIYNLLGEDAMIISMLSILGFGIVSLFTWIYLDSEGY